MARYRESPVLSADGRPILVFEPPYRAAGTGRRFVGLPAPLLMGSNAALIPNLETLRARSRALYRNNALIWRSIETLVSNHIGWGATPNSGAEADATREAIEQAWADWNRQTGFDAIQTAMARESFLAGECFLRFRDRRKTDQDALGRRLVVPLECQLLEAEHCPVWYSEIRDNGNTIRAGIEFDQLGKRVAYWMYREHPGDYIPFTSALNLELVRVPATEVLHLYVPESPGQIRGTPRLARVFLRTNDLEAFDDAALQRQAIAALFAGFIRKPDGAGGVLGETEAAPEPTLEPGTLSYLGEGEDITFPSLPDVGATYAPFVRAVHMGIAAGMGITLEQLTGDLSQVNYSSIRAGSLEFRRFCQMWQHTSFVPIVLEPVWIRFLRRAVLAGALDLPEFVDNELTGSRVEWVFQGWGWIDPLKEVQAAKEEVLAGFATRRSINIRRGDDPERIIEERAAEVQQADQLGLLFSTDVVAAPAPAPAAAEPALPTRQPKKGAA